MSSTPPSKPRLGPTWSKGGKSFKTPSPACPMGEGEIVASATGSLTNSNGSGSNTNKGGNSGAVHGETVGDTTTGSSFINTIGSGTSKGISGAGYGGSMVSESGIGGLPQGRWVNG